MSIAMQERNSRIIDAYSRGNSYSEVGRKFGLSGVRISQIVAAKGANGNGNGVHANGNGAPGNPKAALVTQIKQEIASLTRLLALAEAL